jgi:hypothetical protein
MEILQLVSKTLFSNDTKEQIFVKERITSETQITIQILFPIISESNVMCMLVHG